MPRPRLAQAGQRLAELGGQRGPIRDVGDQPRPSVRHHTLAVGGCRDPWTCRCSLHLESAPLPGRSGPSASSVSPGSGALSSIRPRTRRPSHEEPGLTGTGAVTTMPRPRRYASKPRPARARTRPSQRGLRTRPPQTTPQRCAPLRVDTTGQGQRLRFTSRATAPSLVAGKNSLLTSPSRVWTLNLYHCAAGKCD
jgi:hypothetical protein